MKLYTQFASPLPLAYIRSERLECFVDRSAVLEGRVVDGGVAPKVEDHLH
jgi:hypothetical protein